MKLELSILTALMFVSPANGSAQSPGSRSQLIDSAPPVLELVKANRAGISNERPKGDQSSITHAGIDTSSQVPRGRFVEAGAVIGIMSGAGVGAVVGLVVDSRAERDTMIGVTPFVTAFGAAIGLITGLLVGLFLPAQ